MLKWFSRKQTEPKARHPRPWWRRRRRLVIWTGVVLMVGAYAGYEYITDPARLRPMAERELGKLLGARVTVGRAEASLSGVLLLGDVHIYVSDGPGGELLSAERLDADLKMSRLLGGDVVFEQVLLSQARLNLCENEDTGKWNVAPVLARLHAGGEEAGASRPSSRPVPLASDLPQVLISHAEVVFSQIQQGKYSQRGSIRLDAGLNHISGSHYGFELMGKSTERASTPVTAVVGSVDVTSGEVVAQLRQLSFDQGLVRILPRNVRRLLEEHHFAGAFRVPMLRYNPVRPGAPSFEVRVEFDHLGFVVYPRYLLSRHESRRLEAVQASLALFRSMNLDAPPAKPTPDPGARFVPVHLVHYLASQLESPPMEFRDMAGALVFTNEGLRVEGLAGRFEGNDLVLDAELHGYDAARGYQLDGPARFHVATAEGKRLRIPPTPQFMTWMPDAVRKIYQQFQPVGEVRLEVDVVRAAAGADVDVNVLAEFQDARFTYDDFPYTLYGCSGRLLFGREPSGEEKVTIDAVRGHGAPGGVNEKNFVEINGKVGPFMEGGVGVDLYVTGKNVHSEPALRAAFPREVKKAFRIFGPLDYAQRQQATGLAKPALTPEEELEWPRFSGDFVARAFRLPGPKYDSQITLDLDIQHAWGTLRTFPYPLEDIALKLQVRDDALTIEEARMKRGDAALKLGGTVTFGDPTNPDIKIETKRVPIDEALLEALPRTEREWVRRSGLQGELDIAGRIFSTPTPDGLDTETDFDLGLVLRKGSIFPQAGKPAADGLGGELRLRPSRLELRKVTGKRGSADLDFAGIVDWAGDDVTFDVSLGAKNLVFDKALYALLPGDAREAWDSQKPEGLADVRLHYAGSPQEPATQPAAATLPATTMIASLPVIPVPAPPAATRPATSGAERVELEIWPRKLTVTPEVFPYRLLLSGGSVRYESGRLELRALEGAHETTTVRLSGSGQIGKMLDMPLKISATNLVLDKAFTTAAPSVVASVVQGIGAKGPVNLTLDELRVRESDLSLLNEADRARVLQAQARRAATRPAGAAGSTAIAERPLDVIFGGRVEFLGTSLDVGLPVTDCKGSLDFKGGVRADQLQAFDGALRFASYRIAGIPGDSFSAAIEKPQLKDQVRIRDLRTNLAGGVLAGACTFEWYERASSRYAVDLLLNNASMKEILPREKSFADARLAASLTAEGELSEKGFRRGRGDVRVTGEKMYDLPLLVGLSQVVTLGLPVSEPLNDMRVSYVLDNNKLTLENLELRSPTNLIQGRGTLDFKTRKIDMTLSTESPQKLTIPGLDTLLGTFKKQLFDIRVRGTIREPEVKAETLPTFRATLDEVMRDKK